MGEPKITETRTPAAVGWEWQSSSGRRQSIVWTRGSRSLLFAWQCDDGQWSTPFVMARSRWSCDGTLPGARRVAHEFITLTAGN